MADQGNRTKQVLNPLTGDFDIVSEYDSFLINYVPRFTMESGEPGFVGYMDAAQDTPQDGTGGVGLLVQNISTDLNDKLRGNASLCFEKPAVNLQGHGRSFDFTIDPVDQGKTLKYEFEFRTTANYVDNDMGIYFYDITNSQLIYPSNTDVPASGTVVGQTFRGSFPASIDSTDYRVIFHVKTNSALQYDLCVDHLFIGPFKNSANSASFISDWESWNPTGTWTGNANYVGQYRRVGSEMEGWVEVEAAGVPTPNSHLVIDLPNGHVMDANKLPPNVNAVDGHFIVGHVSVRSSGQTQLGRAAVTAVNIAAGKIECYYDNNAALSQDVLQVINVSGGTGIQSGDFVKINFKVPILGWSTGTRANEIISGRSHVAEGVSNAGGAITVAVTNIDFTVTRDESGAFSGTEYTAQETGDHDIDGCAFFTTTALRAIAVFRDEGSGYVEYKRIGATLTDSAFHFSSSVYLNAGDKIALRTAGTGGTLDNTIDTVHWIKIQKQTNLNSQLVPDDLIHVARYSTDAAQAVNTAAVDTDIIYEDEEFNTGTAGNYNTGTGVFTASRACRLRFEPHINHTGNGSGIVNSRSYSSLNVTPVIGAPFQKLLDLSPNTQTGGYTLFTMTGGATLELLPGDQVKVIVNNSNNVASNLTASGASNFLDIWEIR